MMSGALFFAIATAAAALLGCDAPAPPAPPSPSAAASATPGEQGDPFAETLRAVLEDPDPYSRARRLGALLPERGGEVVPDVKEILDDFRGEIAASDFALLLQFWADHDPAGATDWTIERAAPKYKASGLSITVDRLAERDPAAGIAAVGRVQVDLGGESARVSEMALVTGWFRTDRAALERYMHDMGAGVPRQRAVFTYVLALIDAEGSEAATEWAEAIPGDDRRYKLAVFRQTMSALTWTDMERAVDFCEAHCDGPFGKSLRNALIRARLQEGEYGGDVVEWVAAIPAPDEALREEKDRNLWIAYATWGFLDRDAAMKWMERKTADPEHEAWLRLLYAEYARLLAPDSPVEAIAWAERVEDEKDREQTLVTIARTWRIKDPAAAEAWLETSSLSEQARTLARNPRGPVLKRKSPRG